MIEGINSSKVVHCKKEPYDIYIGRPSKWGNPFMIGKDGNRQDVVEKHMFWLIEQKELVDSIDELYGKTIGCFCAPSRCHGDNLKKLAEMPHNNVCYFCNNESNGTVGNHYIPKLSLKVCNFCYDHVLHMRPTGFIWNKDKINQCIEILLKTYDENHLSIRRYKERLKDYD